MGTILRSAELAPMTEAEREAAFADLERGFGGSEPEFDAEIRRRVRAFEIRYEMSSAQMLEELQAGTQKETAEIAEWLFWLKVSADDFAQ